VDPLNVAVRRGPLVEAHHRVDAIAVKDGAVVEALGDPGLVTFMRSVAKPVQALLVAELDVSKKELAIACASHHASPEQLAAVEALLTRSGSSEDELECGPENGSRLRHNCSGKHAGMLAVCAARGWPREGYRRPGHPLQREVLGLVSKAAEHPSAEIATATDGCGVVTFGLPLERIAHAFARLARGELAGSLRVLRAMAAHPRLVEGPGAAATEVMLAVPGAVAKGGAEGLLAVALPDGTGWAFKAADGAYRATLPAAAHVLGIPALAEIPLENSRGEHVGTIAATFA
jgi:L-asparaginase II